MGKREEPLVNPTPGANRGDALVRPTPRMSAIDQLQVAALKMFERVRRRVVGGPAKPKIFLVVIAVIALIVASAVGFIVGVHMQSSEVRIAVPPSAPLSTLPLIGSTAPRPADKLVGSSGLPAERGPTTYPQKSPEGSIATIAIHAAGAVVSPAVYNLPAGARVDDVIAAAGGLGPEADTDAINLAARVGDGERVFVPRRGSPVPPVQTGGGGRSEPDGVGDGLTSGAEAATRVIDLNAATGTELNTLPGIGPATAQRIIEFRTRVGRFRSVSQLLEVPGIGDAKLASLRPRVRV